MPMTNQPIGMIRYCIQDFKKMNLRKYKATQFISYVLSGIKIKKKLYTFYKAMIFQKTNILKLSIKKKVA